MDGRTRNGLIEGLHAIQREVSAIYTLIWESPDRVAEVRERLAAIEATAKALQKEVETAVAV